MTNEQLKKLEDDLWESANALRAFGGLKASDYAVPVLGLIFLRFAENKYSHFEKEILNEYQQDKGTRMERTIQKVAIAKCGFYLPDNARYEYLLNLSGDKSMAKALKEAMEGIEEHQDVQYQNILPKDVYYDIEKKKKDLLPQLLKTFSDIPKDAESDVFGKIYEYFLGKFALSEGQKGGEFFTPTSVVRFIVEVIEPYSGKIYDPACGSGGMFVQSADFVKHENHSLDEIYVCGQEYMGETVRLAKMNLLVNNIRGEIKEVNSYESDPFKSYGKFDFVMANPPFNVKSVKEATVKNDNRFYEFGLPKNKGKKDDKITDANYLWISLFATSLNKKGRAGFVMPNSASDARNSEYEIRKKIVDSGMVDCIVSMPSNMFFTVTLPATLWFFDKQKVNSDRKDKILFLDARNVYYQIDRAHREWKEENIQNLAAIVRLYRGETNRYLKLIQNYCDNATKAIKEIDTPFTVFQNKMSKTIQSLKAYQDKSKDNRNEKDQKALIKSGLLEKLEKLTIQNHELPLFNWTKTIPTKNDTQIQFAKELDIYLKKLGEIDKSFKTRKDTLSEIWIQADKLFKIKQDKNWAELELAGIAKALDELQQNWNDNLNQIQYWFDNIHWLQKRFPDAEYTDVVGLCKMADKNEYVDEQDYSLNAGRYVGIEIDDDNTTYEEFKNRILEKQQSLDSLNSASYDLNRIIQKNIKDLFEC